MKILKFIIQNYKAARGLHEYVPNGSSFFLIGGNGVGKTSVGHALMDMLTKSIPSKPITEGEHAGYMEFQFSNGSKFMARFLEGKKPQLEFITPDGYNVGSPKEILQRLAGDGMDFSIDDMLKMSPAPLRAKLEKISGLDLADINMRYKKAYDERSLANAKARDQEGRIEPYVNEDAMKEPVPANEVIEKITTLTKKVSEYDEVVKNQGVIEANIGADESLFNNEQQEIGVYAEQAASRIATDYNRALAELDEYVERRKKELLENAEQERQMVANSIDKRKALQEKLLAKIKASKDSLLEVDVKLKEMARPTQAEIDAANLELTNLEQTNNKINHAKRMKKEFLYYEELKAEAKRLDDLVDAIILEKEQAIQKNPLPAKGLAFDDDGNLTIDGLPFEDNQISASRKLKAGIEIANSLLGDIKYLHIDGAALDHASADEVLEFAESHGLQLCIERPEWDGGEIKFIIADQTRPEQPGDEIAPNANKIASDANNIAPDADSPTAQQPE